MANVIHRITLEYRKSVSPDFYDPADWIINPVVPDCDPKYWKIEGDLVLEMTEQEKAQVDDLEEAQRLQAEEDMKDLEKNDKLLRSFGLVVFDEINILRVNAGLSARTFSQFKTAIKNKY